MAKLIEPHRLVEVERRLLKIEAPADFASVLAAEWRCSTRQVWNYVRIVRARLAERARAQDPDADREIVRAMIFEAYATSRLGNEHGPNPQGMVAASKLFADITGVAAPRRLDITTGGKPLGKMTDDELRAEREALLVELGRTTSE